MAAPAPLPPLPPAPHELLRCKRCSGRFYLRDNYGDELACRVHPGQLCRSTGVWSCCGAETLDASSSRWEHWMDRGCTPAHHRDPSWMGADSHHDAAHPADYFCRVPAEVVGPGRELERLRSGSVLVATREEERRKRLVFSSDTLPRDALYPHQIAASYRCTELAFLYATAEAASGGKDIQMMQFDTSEGDIFHYLNPEVMEARERGHVGLFGIVVEAETDFRPYWVLPRLGPARLPRRVFAEARPRTRACE